MIIIEPLQKNKHARHQFSCGKESLDRFIQEQAYQASQKQISRTFVAVADKDETVILGYYTIATTVIEVSDIPPEFAKAKSLPNRGLPGSLVARLAVKENFKGQGIGAMLLADALKRCAYVSQEVGGVGIVVDALEEQVVPFYEGYGFLRLGEGSLKLFLAMETLYEMYGINPMPGRKIV